MDCTKLCAYYGLKKYQYYNAKYLGCYILYLITLLRLCKNIALYKLKVFIIFENV